MRKRTCIWALILAFSALPARGEGLPPVLRGQTSLLLRPAQGPLSITVSKRDLNLYDGQDSLTATLSDPLRETLASVTIPDDGEAGKGRWAEKIQSGTIHVICQSEGIYRLRLTGSGDLVYGFQTNCPRYVIEGWPLLNDPAFGGKVYFKPPEGRVQVAAAAIHEPGLQRILVLDAAGAVVHTLDLTQKTSVAQDIFGPKEKGAYLTGLKAEIPAEVGDRSGLWAFDVQRMDVRLLVQGVEHWTNTAQAWFHAAASRWMLFPYCQKRFLQPGETALVTLRLRNSTGASGNFELSTQADPGLQLRLVRPSGSPVTLEKDKTQDIEFEVRLTAEAPAERPLRVLISAKHESNPDAAATSGLIVHRGEAPARRPLEMPIVLKPYQHENMLFGYAPDYITNEVYFDCHNRPYIRQRTENAYTTKGIFTLTDAGWVERPFPKEIRSTSIVFGGGFLGAKIAFDGQGGAYTLLKIRRKDGRKPALLLFTPDEGRTYKIVEFTAHDFDIEHFTGHNKLEIPPPVLGYRQTRPHSARFCAYHDLDLYLPSRKGNEIDLGRPVLVSDNCVGSCQHSGGPGSLVTREGKTHIVWGEVAPDDAPGVPTYVATYDHKTKVMGKKVFLAYGPPVNDVHNVPAITMDSEGYLHILTGAHGQPFKYLRSLKPNDAYAGFTDPVEVLSAGYKDDTTDADGEGRQTYISLVCGPDDTLHIAYRQWRRGVDEHHPGLTYAALSYQCKPKNAPWSPARPLVIPPLPGYSIYYHKLTIDRRGRLFLSYSYWTDDKTYQDDFPDRYHHRAILTSADGGRTWKLAETEDFRAGIGIAEGRVK